MTFRVLVVGATDWTDYETIEQAIRQATSGREDVALVVGDCPVGTDVLASAAAHALGLWVEQHPTEPVLCARCRMVGQQGSCRRCEAASNRARNDAMVASGADTCLIFLAGGRDRAALRSRLAALSCQRSARAAGIEVREYSTPERLEQKRRANREKARRRQTQILSNGPSEFYTVAEIGERDGWRCGVCEDTQRLVDPTRRYPHPLSPSIDHIVPISSGGPDTKANVRVAHLWCNVERNSGSWHSPEYMRALLTQYMDGTPIPEDLYRRDRAELHARVVAHRAQLPPASPEAASAARVIALEQLAERAARSEHLIAAMIAAGELAADPRYGDPGTRLDPFIQRAGEERVHDLVNRMKSRQRRWKSTDDSDRSTP